VFIHDLSRKEKVRICQWPVSPNSAASIVLSSNIGLSVTQQHVPIDGIMARPNRRVVPLVQFVHTLDGLLSRILEVRVSREATRDTTLDVLSQISAVPCQHDGLPSELHGQRLPARRVARCLEDAQALGQLGVPFD
jgi:hypothetical protein